MTNRHLTARILLTLGLAFLASGLLLGLLPRTALGVSCGSAFRGSNEALVADLTDTMWLDNYQATGSTMRYSTACGSARTATRIPAYVLLLIGGGLVVSGLVVLAPHEPKVPSPTS